jgi:hypothetical protein
MVNLINLQPFISFNNFIALDPPDPSTYKRALSTLNPYTWNRGRTNPYMPIKALVGPDPRWMARGVDNNHVNECSV